MKKYQHVAVYTKDKKKFKKMAVMRDMNMADLFTLLLANTK